MDPTTKNVFDVILSSLSLTAALAAGAWTYFRFAREGAHRPRIELDVDCDFMGPQSGRHVAAFSIYADNKGHIEHKFEEIRLTVRGIRAGSVLEEWVNHGPLLFFPDEIVARTNIVPSAVGYYFVRPSVRQRFSYVTTVSDDFVFVLARVTFRYGDSTEIHTTERVFAVEPTGLAGCRSLVRSDVEPHGQ